MREHPLNLIIPYLFLGLILAAIGLAGLFYVICMLLPTLGPRWLFFFFLVLVISGLVMPIVSFLHTRFSSNPPSSPGVIVRQSIWAGIFVSVLAWLQLGRVLDTPRAVFLAIGIMVIEILLRMRERSQFQPRDADHD